MIYLLLMITEALQSGLAFPMIDINLCMEILELKDKFLDFDVGLSNEQIEKRMEEHMDNIFNLFHDKEKVPYSSFHWNDHHTFPSLKVESNPESTSRERDTWETGDKRHL